MTKSPKNSRIVIALAGPGSNTGKTRFLAELIRHFTKTQAVGALKIATATPDHLCARTGLACGCMQFEGRMRLMTDPAYIERDHKDTGVFHAAGARPVWWLQTTSDFQVEATREVLSKLEGPQVWIVEGAGPIRAGLADIALLMARRDGLESKDSFLELLPRADALILSARHATESAESVLTELQHRGLNPSTPSFALADSSLPQPLLDFLSTRLQELGLTSASR